MTSLITVTTPLVVAGESANPRSSRSACSRRYKCTARTLTKYSGSSGGGSSCVVDQPNAQPFEGSYERTFFRIASIFASPT